MDLSTDHGRLVARISPALPGAKSNARAPARSSPTNKPPRQVSRRAARCRSGSPLTGWYTTPCKRRPYARGTPSCWPAARWRASHEPGTPLGCCRGGSVPGAKGLVSRRSGAPCPFGPCYYTRATPGYGRTTARFWDRGRGSQSSVRRRGELLWGCSVTRRASNPRRRRGTCSPASRCADRVAPTW
jgi:hypothetical protein